MAMSEETTRLVTLSLAYRDAQILMANIMIVPIGGMSDEEHRHLDEVQRNIGAAVVHLALLNEFPSILLEMIPLKEQDRLRDRLRERCFGKPVRWWRFWGK